MKFVITFLVAINLLSAQPVLAFDISVSNMTQIASAFFTNLSAHEYGHAVVGNSVGAEGINVTFLSKEKNNLFLGYTSLTSIDDKSYPAFAIGGEIGASMSFEYALQSYRNRSSVYNKSLLFFSGTDFLWYSIYTFYWNKDNTDADPNILKEETGLSKDVILSVAVAQSILNTYRVI